MKNKVLFWLIVLISGLVYFMGPLSHYAGLIALILGISLSTIDVFYKPEKLNKYRKLVLNSSIIFFGFSLNINEVIAVGVKGIYISLISLVIVVLSGYILMRILKADKQTAELTTYGTAICGGSAISAVSSVMDPTNRQLALATASIFILNAIALVIFPIIGHFLDMSQTQFGVFCALSIHDVSSVVGAAGIYGDQALKLATILKLTRTLWIIPIVLVLSRVYHQKSSKLPIPLFIIGFVGASICSTILNNSFITGLNVVGKVLLPMALFMVGYAIKIEDIKSLGARSILFALILWMISIATGLTLAFIW